VGSFLGVDACAGEDLGEAGAAGGGGDFEGLVHGGWPFTDSDGEDGVDAGGVGAAEDLVAIFDIEVKVGVGVGKEHLDQVIVWPACPLPLRVIMCKVFIRKGLRVDFMCKVFIYKDLKFKVLKINGLYGGAMFLRFLYWEFCLFKYSWLNRTDTPGVSSLFFYA
jgi:hypothetical protein